MRVASPVRRVLWTLFLFIASAFAVNACRDIDSGVTGAQPNDAPRFDTTLEFEIDPLHVTGCPPGTYGAYPHCFGSEADGDGVCDPWDTWCQSSSDCAINPAAPACNVDPCAYTECTGGNTPYDYYSMNDHVFAKSESDNTCPSCGERDPTRKESESIRRALSSVRCSMREVLENSTIVVFTEQEPRYQHRDSSKVFGQHVGGVIYVWDGNWKRDTQGNVLLDSNGDAMLRNYGDFINTLVHEAAHKQWNLLTPYYGATDPSNADWGKGPHHSRWRQTMAECGYPGETG